MKLLLHKIDGSPMLLFKYRPCHLTTGGRIATRIVALTPSMKKITTATNMVNFGSVTLRSIGSFAWVVSALMLKYAVRWLLSHSVGGSSTASL